MLKRIKFTLLTGMVTLLMFLASAGAASACTWWHYQPEVPKKLLK